MTRTRTRPRRMAAAVAVLAAALAGTAAATVPATAAGTAPATGVPVTSAVATAPGAARSAARTAATPLPPELEAIRAAEATALYGSPAERPLAERKTGLISLGDSEISGEGVGSYDPATNRPGNWCHRSPQAAVHRTGIPADVTYNVACSGANSANIRIGGTKQYADELVQSDNLAVKARNTRIKLVLLVAGANDDLQFGPVMTDCVIRYLTLQGPCEPKYAGGWQARVDALVPKIEGTLRDLRTVMRDAGYADGDYRLVLMSYPSPIGPDFRDNPKFPGKLICGGMGYDSDTVWGRDTAVPAFERGLRRAAAGAGAAYLDNSRLFHGREVCQEQPWARGLYVDVTKPGLPDENSVRQSFHPNAGGHGAFASCLTQLYDSGLTEGSCADPATTGSPVLVPGAWDDRFAPLRNAATGSCLDVTGAVSRNGTAVGGWACQGGRNQGWWYDTARQTLITELTHDRCLDVPGAKYEPGAALVVWKCSGAANQRFVRDAGTLRPAAATGLCVTLAAAQDPARLRPCDGTPAQRFA
ncbi:ricin-type beta-trefoil lectin domain protein [Streptomyces sp. LP05-1]|uniref:Ricin-type beta-trefoil lectin domain protein n=1 Tax=Streptomyces pyxinae TaxID=2970734 RepID=A0ABT2CAW0_9ACTN|nr:ricin-type beta-trefoil lectin domain protein [Streptomyces sp. LP05-1]MCS0634493.1 ricin-type beta-trefoil lectin domain protein [Streptomyces sp. LP05-1]